MKDAVMEGEFLFVLLFETQNGFDIVASLRRRASCVASGARSSQLAACAAAFRAFFAGFLHRFLTNLLGLCARLALGAEIFEFVIGKMFDSYKGVACSADPDEFVELDLNGCAIPVLRVLN